MVGVGKFVAVPTRMVKNDGEYPGPLFCWNAIHDYSDDNRDREPPDKVSYGAVYSVGMKKSVK